MAVLGQLAEVFKLRGCAHTSHLDGIEGVMVRLSVLAILLLNITVELALTHVSLLKPVASSCS